MPPICQRTGHRLSPEDERAHGFWVCPGSSAGCAGGESYQDITTDALASAWIPGLLEKAAHHCEKWFNQPRDESPLEVFLGEEPQTFHAQTNNGCHAIYLGRDGNDWMLRRQVLHETFHYVCTPAGVFDWLDEMLADLFVQRFLTEWGYLGDSLADVLHLAHLTEGTGLLSAQELMARSGSFSLYDDQRIYGSALYYGAHLLRELGWERVALLHQFRRRDGAISLHHWATSLTVEEKKSACRILGFLDIVAVG